VVQTTKVALKVGPSTMDFQEMAIPELSSDSALLKMEVAGGKGVEEGEMVFVEHYMPCMNCEWDHKGEYRHCEATEWLYDPHAIRLGYTSLDVAPGLWGGFSHYIYLPHNSVIHKIPEGLSAIEAGIVTPMANGIQWALMDGGVGYGSTVLIQGPGQQGLCCTMSSKHAGAETIIVTGTSKDGPRFEVAKGTAPILLGIEATKRRGGTMVVQSETASFEFPGFPLGRMTRKAMTLKSARGHSYAAVEQALHQLASHRFPLDRMTTHTFGLSEVDWAIKSVGGDGAPGAIHVTVKPWE